MNCLKYIEAINDLVEGEIERRTPEEVNLHVSACPECASRYELLKREKKMYAQFLFDDEPSNDLPIKFRAKIRPKALSISRSSRVQANAFRLKASVARFYRLHPVSIGLVALVLFGIGLGLLKFPPDAMRRAENELAETESSGIQTQIPDQVEIDKDRSADSTPGVNRNSYIASSKSDIKAGGKKFPNGKFAVNKNVKLTGIKPTRIEKQTSSANENANLTADSQLNDKEQMRTLQLRNLERKTAKQMEKVELLLRSFRNARAVKSGEFFDISYEKQQAKKLLEKNAELMRIAENYETSYAEEILSQIERYLLDISNLEIYPSSAKVLDIQERLKNQNLIASLQAYY